jgi:hypothetical protein
VRPQPKLAKQAYRHHTKGGVKKQAYSLSWPNKLIIIIFIMASRKPKIKDRE